MARAARRTFFESSGFRDQLAKRDEEGSEIFRLLLGFVQPRQERRELCGRNIASVGHGLREPVDVALEAQALRVELERPRIALGERRLDLVARKAGPFGAGVEERMDTLHEVEVVGGHGEAPIMSRR